MGLGHSPSIVTNGLVLYLDAGNTKSYPGSGTTWTDLSGNGNGGSGAAYSSNGRGSIYLNATPVACCSVASLGIGSGPFTLSIAVSYSRVHTTTFEIPFWVGVDSGTAGYGLGYSKPNVASMYAGWGSSSGEPTGYSRQLNTWYHLTATYNGTTNAFYVNGSVYSSQAYVASNLTTGSVYLGGLNGPYYTFIGTVAVPMVYNRALTAAEVAQNFNALRGRFGV